jgi:hypothetical protein
LFWQPAAYSTGCRRWSRLFFSKRAFFKLQAGAWASLQAGAWAFDSRGRSPLPRDPIGPEGPNARTLWTPAQPGLAALATRLWSGGRGTVGGTHRLARPPACLRQDGGELNDQGREAEVRFAANAWSAIGWAKSASNSDLARCAHRASPSREHDGKNCERCQGQVTIFVALLATRYSFPRRPKRCGHIPAVL